MILVRTDAATTDVTAPAMTAATDVVEADMKIDETAIVVAHAHLALVLDHQRLVETARETASPMTGIAMIGTAQLATATLK